MKATIKIEYSNYYQVQTVLQLLEMPVENYDATFEGEKNNIRVVKGRPIGE